MNIYSLSKLCQLPAALLIGLLVLFPLEPQASQASGKQDDNSKMAVRIFTEEFRKHFSQCEAFHYSIQSRIWPTGPSDEPRKDREQILQYKGVKFRLVEASPLTAADIANGYSWKGAIEFSFSIGRSFLYRDSGIDGADNNWTEWEDSKEFFMNRTTTFVFKKNGVWDVNLRLPTGAGGSFTHEPISCSDIPPG